MYFSKQLARMRQRARVKFVAERARRNNQHWRLACCLTAGGIALAISGCVRHHAYVSLTVAEAIRDVAIPTGGLSMIRTPAGGTVIVGLDYERSSDHIFARVLPGTTIREIERSTGNIIRTFSAQKVTPGCGGITPDQFPIIECGLAMRWSDRHFFLDNPTGNPITEIDFNGNFVRSITLQNPGGVIGGLAYDQRNDHLYVLYVAGTVAEVDLNGAEIRRFKPKTPIQPQGLGMNSDRQELYIPLVNGDFIGVFDLGGALIGQHALQRSGMAGGVGTGPRPLWR